MNFELDEEYRLIQATVDRFVEQALLPLEARVLAREAAGQGYHLGREELAPLHEQCRELGLWGLDAPAEVGGAELPALAAIAEHFGAGAIQAHGAMGVTKELPLYLMAQRVRVMRIYEGPSEVHRWVLARNRLRPGR